MYYEKKALNDNSTIVDFDSYYYLDKFLRDAWLKDKKKRHRKRWKKRSGRKKWLKG